MNNENRKKLAYVFCNGCPENRLDVARAESYLLKNGYTITDGWHNAELILFNACGRSQGTTSHSIKIITKLTEEKRVDQNLIVWGCLPKIEPAVLDYKSLVLAGPNLESIHLILKTGDLFEKECANYLGKCCLPTAKDQKRVFRYELLLHNLFFEKTVLSWLNFLESRFNLVKGKSVFYIGIATGCRSNCAYCAIRKSRGLVKSKPLDLILSEFKTGRKNGYNNFSLMGTDVAAYGIDLGYNLVDLLSLLAKETGDFKISLRNLNPYHISRMLDELIPILKTGKIRYIEMAAESGSNHVLKLMNRNYTIEEFIYCAKMIKKANPSIILRTQLIAGFPGETEEDFMESMRLLDVVAFDYVEVYEFSLRYGTTAEKIEPKVPDKIKRKRYIQLCRKALFNRTPEKVWKLLLRKDK